MNRALIFRAGALGDTILATGVARSLKRFYPKAQIDFLVAKGIEGLFWLVPYVDRTFVVRYRKVPLEVDPWKRRLLITLDLQGYDLAILLESHVQFAKMFSRVHALRKLSIVPDGQSWERPANVHTVMRYQELLWDAGITPREVFCPSLCVPPQQKERALALIENLRLDPKRPIVGLLPGTSLRQRKKLRRWTRSTDLRGWPEDRWYDLVKGLHALHPGIQFVLFGSKWNRVVNERILEWINRERAPIRAVSSAGLTDIPLAAALMERFRLFICTDSGPIHMAAALGIPIVGLYGPTRFEETSPFCEEGVMRVIKKDLPCQPCYGSLLQKRCRENACMKAIEVSDVMGAVEELGVLSHSRVQ